MIKLGKPITRDIEADLLRVVDAFAADDRVDAVWLFGSRARREADALSDVDIAVLARADLERDALWQAQLHWNGIAVTILCTDDASVQVLNRLPVAVREPMLRDARLLWSRAPERAADFSAATLKQYLDLKPYLDQYDQELFRQAISGTLR
jgi:hypothetical protein